MQFPNFSDEDWSRLISLALSLGAQSGGVLILVAARLAGLLFIGPLLGRAVLTWPVRIGLVVVLTAIVAPQLSAFPQTNSVNVARYTQTSIVDQTSAVSSWGTHTSFSSASFLLAVLRDAVIGAAMGLSIAVFLSGLKLASEWFDRHSGLEMASVLNPESLSEGSGPGEIIWMFCVASLLVIHPVNGHLVVVRLILDSFTAVPIGIESLPEPLIELPGKIAHQSLVLGLRIALPFVVSMSLLDLTLGFSQRSIRWQLAPTVFAVRGGVSLLVLAATFPGIQEAAAMTLREVLQTANETITSE